MSDLDQAFVLWMRSAGVPEDVIRHFEETGILDGRLWPLRDPLGF